MYISPKTLVLILQQFPGSWKCIVSLTAMLENSFSKQQTQSLEDYDIVSLSVYNASI